MVVAWTIECGWQESTVKSAKAKWTISPERKGPYPQQNFLYDENVSTSNVSLRTMSQQTVVEVIKRQKTQKSRRDGVNAGVPAKFLGDFNATSPAWSCGVDDYNLAGKQLEPMILRYHLAQCVDFPTHIRNDGSFGATLDLLLTNYPEAMNEPTSLLPLGQSDHVTKSCTISTNPAQGSTDTRQRRIYLYDGTDFEHVCKSLSED